MRQLFFVSCTRRTKEETPLFRSLQELQLHAYHFFEHNRRGLPACYNQFLDKLAGTDLILVLAHSDVLVADVFIQHKLNESIKTFNIAGLVGSSYFDLARQTPHYAWPIWPHGCLSGAVEHLVGDGLATWFSCGPTPRRCVVLDGLFLAIDLLTIGNVRFDERFAFHLYDLDFCLTAHRANLVLGTTNVYVQHASCGNFSDDSYAAGMQTFRAKWSAITGAEGRTLQRV